MKKTFLAFLALFVSIMAFAQRQDYVTEVGLTYIKHDSYGFTYRFGTPKSLWRLNAFSLKGTYSKMSSAAIDITSLEYGAGFSFGHEFRWALVDRVDLRIGADLSYLTDYYKIDVQHDENSTSTEYSQSLSNSKVGLNAVLGLNYRFGSFIAGLEFLPGLYYVTSSGSNTLLFTGSSNSATDTNVETKTPLQCSFVYQF